MIRQFISFFGDGQSSHYKQMSTIVSCGNDIESQCREFFYADAISVSENILYSPNFIGIRDRNSVNQDYVETIAEVERFLKPIQKSIGTKIISSAIVSMPEKLQKAMRDNPLKVLDNVRPASKAIYKSDHDSDDFAVLFYLSRVPFISFLKPSALISLDCQFHEYWLPIEKQLVNLNLKPVVASAKKVVEPVSTSLQGEIFRDNSPEMVMLPAGDFLMGDVQGSGLENELPVHRVSIDSFAMGRYLVSFAEYDEFAEATGREKPDDENWGRENRPVINVSWYEAIEYTEWLSEQRGHEYSLPTEAQWEYAAKAGVDTNYPWGNDIGVNRLNCRNSGSPWSGKRTAPIGSFPPNAFGLFDILGNLWTWTSSAYTDKYDGSEQRSVNKKYRDRIVLRGGSWNASDIWSRTTFRYRYKPPFHLNTVGFRIIRS